MNSNQFIDNIPPQFLKQLKDKVLNNQEHEALDLSCQYVIKYFTYIPYQACYHHGHFVYALLDRAMKN